MAIKLRTLKGTALTYEEVDRNFSQYFYSASYDDSKIYLWYTGSTGLNLPGENYGPRVGATIPFITGTGTVPTPGTGTTLPGGTTNGNIQYRAGTQFGGDDRFHFDPITGYVGIGKNIPDAPLHVFSTTGVAGKIRLSAIASTTDNGGATFMDFYKGTTAAAEIGLTSPADSLLSINSLGTAATAGIKFGIAGSVKGYFNNTGFGVSNASFGGNVTPNRTLTVIGGIGVGNSTGTNDQSVIRQQPGDTINVSLLPTSASPNGLLIESPKGVSGGNIIMGLNSTLANNEAFSIVRGLQGAYDTTLATFRADGNVGIGEVNPTEKLHVNGKVRTSGIVLPSDPAYYDIGSKAAGSTIRIGVNGGTFDRNLYFGGNDNNGVFSSQIALINSTGNVGIGTTDPQSYRLNVNGTTNIGGTLNVVGATTLNSTVTIEGNTIINGNLTVKMDTITQEDATSTGTYSAKNITGFATDGATNNNWFTKGGIVVGGSTVNSTVPVLGFSQQGTSVFGSSIHLLSNGEFRFLKQDGTTLANISATTITATTLNGNHVGNWNGVTYSNANSINTIVQRDNSGYIHADYFRTTGGLNQNNSGLGLFSGFISGDAYIRGFTPQAAAEALSGKTMNIVGSASTIKGYTEVTTDNWNSIYDDGQNIRLLNIYDIPTTTTNINSRYGTVLQISGQIGHDKTQLIFNGQDGDIQYRKAFYKALPLVSTWSNLRTIIDTNNLGTYALPIGGGTVTGDILFEQPSIMTTKRGIRGTVGTTDAWFVGGSASSTDAGFLELATGKNSNEPIYASQYANIAFNTSPTRRAALLDTSGNSYFPGNLSIGSETNTTHRLNVNGTANITSTLAIGGATTIGGGLSVTGNTSTTGTFTAKNITGESTSYVATQWHREGGLVTRTVNASSVGPAIGFFNPTAYAGSIQLAAAGQFKFWNENGTTLANITATSFTGSLLGPATSINIGSNETISNLNITTTGQAAVRFDTFNKLAENRPATSDNANGVITFTTNHITQYGKQIAFVNSDDLWIRNLSAGVYQNWKKILHDGNYTDLVPSKTGVGATGTNWNISITGNANYATSAGTATTATDANFLILQRSFTLDNAIKSGIYRQEAPAGGAAYYSATLNMNSDDGRSQINIDRQGNGMLFRATTDGTNTTSWTPWRTVLHSNNFSTYALPLTGGRLRGDVGIDAGVHLWFGREGIYGAPDPDGTDYGYIVYINNEKKYGTGGSSETSVLRIGTFNDTGEAAGDNIAIEPANNLYLNPGASIYKGEYSNRKEIVDTSLLQSIGAPVPAGGIIMWSGDPGSVPSHWAICDGRFINGRQTPDLRNRFVIGSSATSGTPTTNITGTATITGGSKDAVVVEHTHTFEAYRSWNSTLGLRFGTVQDYQTGNTSGTTNGASNGVSGTNQNLPPYYALAYIMYGGGPLV